MRSRDSIAFYSRLRRSDPAAVLARAIGIASIGGRPRNAPIAVPTRFGCQRSRCSAVRSARPERDVSGRIVVRFGDVACALPRVTEFISRRDMIDDPAPGKS
ncbi:hypothetical protein [Burkholderia latens]|uniref:hypothetical protein n=1 Tax=Burkholderia latens TaxID=488446 RepID=UPI00147809BC|nr:hypothetical protein [Burkholderia latens]